MGKKNPRHVGQFYPSDELRINSKTGEISNIENSFSPDYSGRNLKSKTAPFRILLSTGFIGKNST
jgi:hypothetical protein